MCNYINGKNSINARLYTEVHIFTLNSNVDRSIKLQDLSLSTILLSKTDIGFWQKCKMLELSDFEKWSRLIILVAGRQSQATAF